MSVSNAVPASRRLMNLCNTCTYIDLYRARRKVIRDNTPSGDPSNFDIRTVPVQMTDGDTRVSTTVEPIGGHVAAPKSNPELRLASLPRLFSNHIEHPMQLNPEQTVNQAPIVWTVRSFGV